MTAETLPDHEQRAPEVPVELLGEDEDSVASDVG
jgi:hypothetical protein